MLHKNASLRKLLQKPSYYDVVRDKVLGRLDAYTSLHPEKKTFVMAYGDTSQPVAPPVVKAMVEAAHRLGDPRTYTGYEPIIGMEKLREELASWYQRCP
jgi:LL-diaminopimelate aminotransferase